MPQWYRPCTRALITPTKKFQKREERNPEEKEVPKQVLKHARDFDLDIPDEEKEVYNERNTHITSKWIRNKIAWIKYQRLLKKLLG